MMHHPRHGAAWTLMLLGLLILIGFAMIAIPGQRRNSERQMHERLNRDYMRVLMAKEAWAVHRQLSPGATVTMDELTSHGQIIKVAPEWPPETTFELGAVGTHPTLTWRGEKVSPLPTRQRERFVEPEVTPAATTTTTPTTTTAVQ